jgi:hypothetical protein
LTRKSEQLKDDFTFNLTLLEARDQEIRRLEGVVDASNSRINSLEVEIYKYDQHIARCAQILTGYMVDIKS